MQINLKMAFKMHLNGSMLALFTFTFFFGLLAGEVMGEGISNNAPLQQKETLQQYASSLRVDETKKELDAAEKELRETKALNDPKLAMKIAQLEVNRDKAKEKYDQAVAELQSNINQANQNNLRNQQLTSNESNSNGHQSKGGSSKGGGSGSKGGMPPMPPPPSPPKKDSNEDAPAQESPKPETAQTPATPPKDLTPAADPKEEALSAELQKQLADLTAVNPNGTPKAENELPETSTTLVAQKLAKDTVKQSEEMAAKILTPAVEPPKKLAAAPIDSSTKSTSRVSQNRPPQGLAGAMAAQIPSAPTATAANQTDSRVASIAPAQSQTTQRALRAASGETAQAPNEEETPNSAPAFDMASLLGSPAEAPQSQDFNQTALRSERLTRSVRQDPLVNPNAPILPSALRAVMEGNKLVTGTPANR